MADNKITKTEIENKIKKTIKDIKVRLKLLKVYHDLAMANKDYDRIKFEEAVKAEVGEQDFSFIKHTYKY